MITSSDALSILLDHWNLSGEIIPLDSEWGGTFRITYADTSCLLKISPDTFPSERIRLEHVILTHLERKPRAFAYPAIIPSTSGSHLVETTQGIARLYHWIHGNVWAEVNPHHPTLLRQVGEALGHLDTYLSDIPDHAGAHVDFEWSLESSVWQEGLDLLPASVKSVARSTYDRYVRVLEKKIASLPHGILYHDANDYNILVSADSGEIGFIDFGDCHYGPRIYDLAICLAYVLMGQSDIPGAVRSVVGGYNNGYRLQQEELEVLQDLISVRLITSLVHATLRKARDPENAYWQISAQPAAELLLRLTQIDAHLFLCYCRAACGFEPSPKNVLLRQWLTEHRDDFAPVLGIDLSKEHVTVFDWSVGSTALGGLDALDDLDEQTHRTFQRMQREGTRVGVGRYDEPRPVYTSGEYAVPGLHTTAMRTVHLGIDLFMPPGTPVYAPIGGEVVTVTNNAGDKEYGPLVILRHRTETGLMFYTLYGHHNIYTLTLLSHGQEVSAGQKIGEIGDYPENGNWVPHLHFQVITDLLGYADDYPGVADPDARDIWLSLCPDPNLILGISHPELVYTYADKTRLVERRRTVLGANLSLSYSTPLHIVRGWKSRLFDEAGRSYLDTVNNIAHVGHEHPRVVHAGQQQMAVLNTNTRYVHTNIVRCAGQLLSILPEHLEVIWFVNSGSEANELALRIARHFTGKQDVLVLEEGYHGNTQTCIDVSHHKFKHLCQADWITVVPMQMYRQTGEAPDVDRPLVFLHETLPCCAGQIVPHPGFFRRMYTTVKQHGGICIADEVQTGLGRVGEQMWAFEVFDLKPDIVTIGKPLGNGHPVAAVAVTRELAEAFSEGPEFFSSFGGNPVSCAIASEVMSVVRDEGLQEHALQMGRYWMDELKRMQSAFPVIRDVRGSGLFIGVEFADAGGNPATQIARYIRDRMVEHRILTSLDGPGVNVMKIKPPMVIKPDEVVFLLQVLEKILSEDRCRTGH